LLPEALDNLVCDTVGAHLGRLVVRGDALVGGDEILGLVARLEVEGLLNTAVEKEGDVGILFGLGDVHLFDLLLSEPLGKNIAHVLGLEGDLEGVVELVLRHGNEGDLGIGEVGPRSPVNVAHELGDLANAVGAVVEEEDNVAICCLSAFIRRNSSTSTKKGTKQTLDPTLLPTHDNGLEELVILPLLVALLDSLNRVIALLALAEHHTLHGQLNTLPPLIAIHGIVAANGRGDLANTNLLQLVNKLLHVPGARLGVGIAPIAEEVDVNLGDARSRGGLYQGVEVRLLGVLRPD